MTQIPNQSNRGGKDDMTNGHVHRLFMVELRPTTLCKNPLDDMRNIGARHVQTNHDAFGDFIRSHSQYIGRSKVVVHGGATTAKITPPPIK